MIDVGYKSRQDHGHTDSTMHPINSRWRELTGYLSSRSHLHNLLYVLAGGYALGLWFWEHAHPQALGPYLLSNQIAVDARPDPGALLLAMGLALAVWVGSAVVLAAFTHRSLALYLNLGSALLVACVLAPFVPVLSIPAIEKERPLFLFAMVGVMALVAGMAVHEAVRQFTSSEPTTAANRRRYDRFGLVFIILLAVGYAVYMSLLTVGRHNLFLTHAFDLGVYDQSVWNILHSGYMRSTQHGLDPINHASKHFSPIFLLLAPVYALYQDARNLLIVQSLALAAAAIPIYLLARRKTESVLLALVLGASYLLAPSLHGVNTFDFHELALVTVLLATALYALETDRDLLFLVSLGLSLAVKEEVALTGAAIGLYIIVAKRRYRLGAAVMAISLVYFVLVIKVLMPALGGDPLLDRFGGMMTPEAGGISGIVRTLVANPFYTFNFVLLDPAKLTYLVQLLLPVVLTPLLGGLGWIAAAPSFAVPFLSSAETQFSIAYHYSAHLLPFVYFLAILGVQRLGVRIGSKAALAAAILVASLAMNYTYGWVFSKQFEGMPQRTAHAVAIGQIVQTAIPRNAAVSAMSDLVPHLSARKDIYLFPIVKDAEYILFDTDSRANFWPYEGPKAQSEAIAALLPYVASGAYGIVEWKDGVILLQKGSGSDDTGAAVSQVLTVRFEAEALPSDLNAPDLPSEGASEGVARRITPDLVNASGKTAIVFGPYARLYPGRYRVNFLMKLEGNPGSGPLATVDVYSHLDGGNPRAAREISAADFTRPGAYQPITLELDLGQTLDDVEFRAMYGGSGELWLDAIEVVPLAVQLPPEAAGREYSAGQKP